MNINGFRLRILLHEGLSEPEFYGDLLCKFRKIMGRTDFSDQFRKFIIRYKVNSNNLNVMRQSACLVFRVNNVAAAFMHVGGSGIYEMLDTKLFIFVGLCQFSCLVHRGSIDDSLLLQILSGVV